MEPKPEFKVAAPSKRRANLPPWALWVIIPGSFVLCIWLLGALAGGDAAGGVGIVWGCAMVIIGGFLYFLPSIIASKKKNFGAIFTLNLLLGWTLIGWVVALVWAMTKD